MAPRQKPPLELDWEVETADGDFIRLPADAAKASNRPTGSSGGSQRGDGFSTGGLTLNRQIFRDWPDLNLLDTWRAIGRSGDVAYEGRLQSMPRTKGEGPEQISAQLAGWMTYLKSRPIAPLIIDRRLGGWTEASLQRRAGLLSSNFVFSANASAAFQASGTTGPGLYFDFGGATKAAGYNPGTELWFYAGGEDISLFKFDFVGDGTTTWAESPGLSSDDLGTSVDQPVNFNGTTAAGQGIPASTSGRKYAFAQAFYTGTFTGQLTNAHSYRYPRVVGAHGLTARGSSPEEGYYVSDIIQFLLARYYPKINWAGEQNTFPLTQCTWHDSPTTGYDAIQTLNNLVMWETNVWENRTLYFEPADLTKADWIIRTDDAGVTVNFQGESIENYANGIVVTYSDFFGHTYTLYPDAHPELQDANENNAATRHGEPLWITETVEWQCLEGEALQYGRAKLAEFNRPKRPGSFTVKGHIRDGAGHYQPFWKPRSSETLMIQDHPSETEPRLIYDVSWDTESESATITVDGPPQTMTAIAARNVLALQAANLS